ncbi:MAG: cellulase family glycosylhydrolase [Chitinophagales bacterium]
MKQLYILLIFSFLIFSCKKENNTAVVADDPSIFQDQYGRQLILHGLNTGEKNPAADPWIQESDVDREDKEFGFNFVRYLILWDGIEPQKDSFDYSYLDRIEQRVNWYTSRGMYVMLDMHQDIYSIVFGGDGAPAWAVHANGHPINTTNTSGAWFLKNLDPAVVAALGNFWDYTTYKELQDHYILMWKKVLERFKNNPNVIGYDVMNEPYGGDFIKALTGDFEKNTLKKFYDKLIPAMRSVEPDKYLFFEPQSLYVNFGVTSNLPKINDTRSVPHLGYAPHFYPFFVEAAVSPYDATAKQNTRDCFNSRTKEMKKQNCPMIIGETGLSPSTVGFGDFLDDMFHYLDSTQSGISYWFNGHGGWAPLNADRSETPILQHLLRTYPKATAGKISKFRFDPVSKKFSMTFISNAAITQPTEIFIPNRFYPAGWNLSVTGTTNYTQTFDAARQVLKFSTSENAKEITIEVLPK